MQAIIRYAGTALLGVLLLGAQGCDVSKDKSIADAAVVSFHAELDAAQFAQMWDDADDSLRRTTSHDDYNKLITAVHRKLGKVVSTEGGSWSVNYINFQTRVTLEQQTQFEHGAATETFLYIVRKNGAKLAAYHVNSDELMSL